MSNFDNLNQVTQAKSGSAPHLFCASTPDNLAKITTAGYMTDLAQAKIVKPNDRLWINYADTSTYPLNTGMKATFGVFNVTYANNVWSLTQVTTGA